MTFSKLQLKTLGFFNHQDDLDLSFKLRPLPSNMRNHTDSSFKSNPTDDFYQLSKPLLAIHTLMNSSQPSKKNLYVLLQGCK